MRKPPVSIRSVPEALREMADIIHARFVGNPPHKNTPLMIERLVREVANETERYAALVTPDPARVHSSEHVCQKCCEHTSTVPNGENRNLRDCLRCGARGLVPAGW